MGTRKGVGNDSSGSFLGTIHYLEVLIRGLLGPERAGRGAAVQLALAEGGGPHNEARSDEVIRASFGGYESVGASASGRFFQLQTTFPCWNEPLW